MTNVEVYCQMYMISTKDPLQSAKLAPIMAALWDEMTEDDHVAVQQLLNLPKGESNA